ncbi:o-succinylbenzoate synthase [Synechococcus sp. CS-1327]|uniref:o-succinylbenzoate synthase n=1 Tax=Synechococcus sp. CS-1326 TaxID=2847978 RepID=UPI00223B3601|nr:o-succinylbenzoate synthase [Synechococcus sp. CS-1326]MCT0214171.1 o-succinylbenzoate synthase [Synechococcus sp. CS-1326]MCT0232501.1 o-succinylbenzoate synthase [Synechococcus sp. CS-1327]
MAGSVVRLVWRPFRLALTRPLVTAWGTLAEKRGWLLLLELGEADGGLAAAPAAPPVAAGWGEAAPLPSTAALAEQRLRELAAAIEALGCTMPRQALEAALPELAPELGFAIGMALAEADGLVGAAPGLSGPAGGWRAAPPSAMLLPAGEGAPAALEQALARWCPAADFPALPFTCKWKVAAAADGLERQVLEDLLGRLPAGSRLRLDANGGWDRATAWWWAGRLVDEPRLQWLEQPLAPGDQAGLEQLAARLPVALDESLRERPQQRRHWRGWQVRRPSLEGDPRPLLAQLQAGVPRLMLSTAFETGIGRRWLDHLAALQAEGPTPAAPGLAPGWGAAGPLVSRDPELVWEAA